jgi:NTE family protein
MKSILSLYTWLRRLPWSFTVSLLVSLLASLGIVSSILHFFELRTISDAILRMLGPEFLVKKELPGAIDYILQPIPVFFEGLVTVLIFVIAVLLSYNFAGWVSRKLSRPPKVFIHDPVSPAAGSGKTLEKFMKAYGVNDLRIGIILAGGGAKGAFQAGAMKAIYEFLEENNGLDKVKMIAGTSIGSWNSMFWMAGLIKGPGRGQMSAHERWWKEVRLNRVIAFAPYVPFTKNYFLYTTPWQQTFKAIFNDTPAIQTALRERLFQNPQQALHFYLTRSNVESGRLEFATNNITLPEMTRPKAKQGGSEPIIPRSQYELIEDKEGIDVLERMQTAVFASMDLPPLFQYMNIEDELFEDGGVVDNLPVRFATAVEKCNLLFILPLNASFESPADQKSLVKRLQRVMDVRQGVLERESMKLTYLYNNIAKLKAQPKKAELVSVFAICPEQPLVINTSELYKTNEAGDAFDLMYRVTRNELADNFLEAANPEWLRLALVSPLGEITYREDF